MSRTDDELADMILAEKIKSAPIAKGFPADVVRDAEVTVVRVGCRHWRCVLRRWWLGVRG